MGALQMYIKAGLPAKAARIAIAHPDISSQTEVIERIASQLVKGGLYERVWNMISILYVKIRSLNCFYRTFNQLKRRVSD